MQLWLSIILVVVVVVVVVKINSKWPKPLTYHNKNSKIPNENP